MRPLCGSQTTNPLLENRQQNNNTTDVVTPVFPPPRPKGCGGCGHRVTAVIAWGKRPVPSRTRKLRPTAPMVLHPGGCGRVGHRRNTINGRGPQPPGWGPPAFNDPLRFGAPGGRPRRPSLRPDVPTRPGLRMARTPFTGPAASAPRAPGSWQGIQDGCRRRPRQGIPSRPARTMGPVPNGQRPGRLPGSAKSAGGDRGGIR